MAKCTACEKTSIIPLLRGWVKDGVNRWYCTYECKVGHLMRERIMRQTRRHLSE